MFYAGPKTAVFSYVIIYVLYAHIATIEISIQGSKKFEIARKEVEMYANMVIHSCKLRKYHHIANIYVSWL